MKVEASMDSRFFKLVNMIEDLELVTAAKEEDPNFANAGTSPAAKVSWPFIALKADLPIDVSADVAPNAMDDFIVTDSNAEASMVVNFGQSSTAIVSVPAKSLNADSATNFSAGSAPNETADKVLLTPVNACKFL